MKTKGLILLASFVSLILTNCETSQKKYKDPREHDSAMKEAYQLQSTINYSIEADFETIPVAAGVMEDAADDPAFYYNSESPESSLIIGTDKKHGLYVYNLDGEVLRFYKVGQVNNVDIRQDVAVGEQKVNIVAASNEDTNGVSVFQLKGDSLITLNIENPLMSNKMDEVYGFCMYKNAENKVSLIANAKNGRIEVYALNLKEDLSGKLELTNTYQVASQPEGMVVDDVNNMLYIGEESNGIWKVNLLDSTSKLKLIASSKISNNKNIEADIEGIALYKTSKDTGYLVASSQGNFSYALFSIEDERYITSFKIVDGPMVDGVEETDGLEVCNKPIGSNFPTGALIVQDGFNYDGDSLKAQNFKVISWEKIQTIIDHQNSGL
ncbi:phytase [Flammeovirga agarivorans]|uniref:Phytase n=1 Tax=Flammeovirga agarivorans TaxID=2726742 RepID=A0A7X8SIG6_9BACT|nr:phytase [Flammeovirga agarivorans]NLR90849.1 phytase [Flammeovirga agarivorans]